MKILFAPLILLIFTVAPAVAAQNSYVIPDDLQVITATNAAQLEPLVQLGSVAPRDVSWSPNGQTLLATTYEGLYRYRLDNLDDSDFFAYVDDLQYSPTENFAFSDGQRLNAETLEVVDERNQTLIADGKVIAIDDTVDDSPVIRLVDAATMVEFATLPTSGEVVLSDDRRHAAVWHLTSNGDDDHYSLPYHLELWDIATNNLVMETDYGYSIFFPPQFTDRWLITGTTDNFSDGIIEVRDLKTGQVHMRQEMGDEWRIIGNLYKPPIISADERFMLILGEGANLISLEKDEPEKVLSFLLGDYGDETPPPTLFTADGTILAVDTRGGIEVYSLKGEVHLITKINDTDTIMMGHKSPIILGKNFDNTLSIWQVNGENVELRFSHAANEGDILLSPDDQLLFISSGDLIDLKTGETIYTFPPDITPQFNADWSYAAYWLNNILNLVDIHAGSERVLRVLENDLGTLESINVAAGLALFRGSDSVTRIYDLSTGQLRQELGNPTDVYFNVDGRRLVTTDEDNTSTTIWNIESETPVALLTLELPVWASAISADGHWFGFITSPTPPPAYDDPSLSWQYDSPEFTIAIWHVDTNVQFSQQTIYLPRKPILKFSLDNHLLTITSDTAVQFCRITLDMRGCPGVILNSIDTGLYASDVVLSPDSQSFAASIYSIGRDGTIYRNLYVDAADPNQYYIMDDHSFPFISGTTALFSPDNTLLLVGKSGIFSPDSQLIVTGGWGLGLWDVAALKAVEPWQIHSVDGLGIYATKETLQLWSIPSLQKGADEPLATFDHQHIRGLAFNPAGTILFVYEERRVTLWGIRS